MKRLLYIIPLLTFLFSCEKSEDWNTAGETLFLKSDGAVLPIWVTGNVSSGVFIICNHGGPGYSSSAHEFHASTSFKNLEEKYAVVYYDQRFSGNSMGDPITGSITIQHHITDLDRVITLIEELYSPTSTFIYGHSWGGGLTLAYLGWEGFNKNINGFIDSDGALQDKWEMELKRDWQVPAAEIKLTETGDDKWQEVIDWWEANPYPDEGDDPPYEFIGWFERWIYDADQAAALNPSSSSEKHFSSPFQIMSWTDSYDYTNFVAGYDHMEEATKITQPALLIWGKEDGAVPYQVADSLYQLLQTPEADKYNIQYEECCHTPHYEKPDEFYTDVVSFIEKYR